MKLTTLCVCVQKIFIVILCCFLQPWFDAQFATTQAMANSIDYLLSFVSNKGEAGRCTDFESNPYATVLIPEPMDYFSACSGTSMCEAKCRSEYNAFDR